MTNSSFQYQYETQPENAAKAQKYLVAAQARIAELEAKLKEFERVGWQRKSNTFGWVDVENDQLDRAIQAGCEIRQVFAIPKLEVKE